MIFSLQPFSPTFNPALVPRQRINPTADFFLGLKIVNRFCGLWIFFANKTFTSLRVTNEELEVDYYPPEVCNPRSLLPRAFLLRLILRYRRRLLQFSLPLSPAIAMSFASCIFLANSVPGYLIIYIHVRLIFKPD